MNTSYLSRKAEKEISRLVKTYPAVVIVGPRQVGKTSLVKHLQPLFSKPATYLDLELPVDFNKFANPDLYLETLGDQTVIIDEVQRLPSLFPTLRALIDRNRQPGRFILLGSASPELIRDTSESLAGRVAYFELPPLAYDEICEVSDYQKHWTRGGFPESLLASDDKTSFEWRLNFIQSYLERDLPLLGLNADPMLIRRLWTMAAHSNAGLLNMENFGKSLGISGPTVRRYLDFLESAYLIRRLPPYHFNIKKRLVKTPKMFIRDTGILHALLNIGNFQQLIGHPTLGGSWEGYILQEIAALAPARTELFFYRTQDGTEADLVIAPAGVPETLVEIKFSTTPKVTKGMVIAKEDLQSKKHFIVCPVEEGYPLSEDFIVLSYKELNRIFE